MQIVGGVTMEAGFTLASGSEYGEAVFTTPGTYSWTVPLGISSVCVVCVGAGGGGWRYQNGNGAGGAGGALGWKNNIAVTPGATYTVQVGAGGTSLISTGNDSVIVPAGGDSWFISPATVRGGGGQGSVQPGADPEPATYTGDGGGLGGTTFSRGTYPGAGGAGGYSGPGGGGGRIQTTGTYNGFPGQGGGGGGGGTGYSFAVTSNPGAGGGVGINGQGSDGAGGAGNPFGFGDSGQPGSGGSGKTYGGGARGNGIDVGGGGAVRIIWGPGRSFPTQALIPP